MTTPRELPVLRPPKLSDFNGADYTASLKAPPAIRPPPQDADQVKLQRANEAKAHAEALKEAIGEYEALRPHVHEILGRIYAAYVAHNNLTSFPSPLLPLKDFRDIHIPTLLPRPFIDAGWTTCAAAMADPQAARKWPRLT